MGIKTGNTDQAGGCFLLSAQLDVEGNKVTVVSAVLGAPSLARALSDSDSLAKASTTSFESINIAQSGQTVGYYSSPWSKTADIISAQNKSLVAWRGQVIELTNNVNELKPLGQAGQTLGNIKLSNGDQVTNLPVVLKQPLAAPSLYWRILHPKF